MRKNIENSLDIVFPPLMGKMKEVFIQEFLKDDTEMSAILAFKVRGELKEQGYKVKELPEPTFREIAEKLDKEAKKDKNQPMSKGTKT